MDPFQGMRKVAVETGEEQAALLADLLESAGFTALLAWLDDSGHPHIIPRQQSVAPAAGLLPPVTNPFAVYVPEEDAEEALLVLRDAGKAGVKDAPFAS
jgi:hypothetical protein